MKRFLAFTLAVILLLSISGIAYYRMDRARRREEQRIAEKNEAYESFCSLIGEERYTEALAQADKCLTLYSEESDPERYADILLKLACVEAVQGDKESSLHHCEEVLRMKPDAQEAVLLSSGLYDDLGQKDRGEEALRRYMELSGDRSYGYRLGLSAMQEEKYQQAVDDLSLYIDYSFRDSEHCDDALYFRGVCYLALESYENAAKDFERCVLAHIEYGDSLFNAALARLLNKEPRRALTLFERCVSENIQVEKAAGYVELTNEMLKEESANGSQQE